MPIQKFSSFEDARRALVVDRDDPSLPDRVARVWDLAGKLTGPLDFRGVRRYRSVDEADADWRRLVINRRACPPGTSTG